MPGNKNTKAKKVTTGNIITSGGIEDIRRIAGTKGNGVAKSMALLKILNESDRVEDALARFYMFGSEFPALFAEDGTADILKEIYTHFNTTVNEKIKDVIGVTTKNAYIFRFLTESLPLLQNDGLIKTRIIDDLVKPDGLVSLMMKEIDENHKDALNQIDNAYYIQASLPGNVQQEVEADKEAAVAAYSKDFAEKLERITQLFSESDAKFIYGSLMDLSKRIENGALSLAAPAPQEGESTSVGGMKEEDLKLINEKLDEVIEQGKKNGQSLENLSAKPVSTEDNDTDETDETQGEVASSLTEVVMEKMNTISQTMGGHNTDVIEALSNISSNLKDLMENNNSKEGTYDVAKAVAFDVGGLSPQEIEFMVQQDIDESDWEMLSPPEKEELGWVAPVATAQDDNSTVGTQSEDVSPALEKITEGLRLLGEAISRGNDDISEKIGNIQASSPHTSTAQPSFPLDKIENIATEIKNNAEKQREFETVVVDMLSLSQDAPATPQPAVTPQPASVEVDTSKIESQISLQNERLEKIEDTLHELFDLVKSEIAESKQIRESILSEDVEEAPKSKGKDKIVGGGVDDI